MNAEPLSRYVPNVGRIVRDEYALDRSDGCGDPPRGAGIGHCRIFRFTDTPDRSDAVPPRVQNEATTSPTRTEVTQRGNAARDSISE